MLSLILGSIFAPSFSEPNHKLMFNALLKSTFDFEATNFIEELLSSLLKEQLAEDGLRVNNGQVQKMIDVYTALRVNQFVLLAGRPLGGKTTVWKTITKAINSLQNKESGVVSAKIY